MSEITEGDHVIYKGPIPEHRGKKARVDVVREDCYVVRFLESDMVAHVGKESVERVWY